MLDTFYVKEPKSRLFRNIGEHGEVSGSKQLLLGQRLHVDLSSENNGWVLASTVPKEDKQAFTGFIELTRLSQRQQLKVFYADVGQGDATLIEAQDAIIIIDGGPNRGFSEQLEKRLKALQRADEAVGNLPRQTLHVNAIIISHFDKDHYAGLTRLLNNTAFTFGSIYHNGLPRYGEGTDKGVDLGDLSISPHGGKAISTDLRGFDSAQMLIDNDMVLAESGGLNLFGKFLNAAIKAKDQNRLDKFELLVKRRANNQKILPGTGDDIEIEILAPVTTTATGHIKLQAFHDPHKGSTSPTSSHTINGNSIVLKLTFGQTTFLFGGDLNQPSQRYLYDRYGNFDRFSADVNKACHHGSSDFDIEYVKAINPMTSVFSTGDNGNYDHPMPDAMGSAARHSQGDFPLIFSTELARETGSRIHYGHINARSNGDMIVMAQKKESPSIKKTWHSFTLPYAGPFSH